MVGRHTLDELPGVARQLLALGIDANQVGKAHVQAHLERLQVARATLALPACGQDVGPVQRLADGRQQRLDAGQHALGVFQEIGKTGIH